jgi:UDP-2,4-diacetamido-2,4,6-trideoxy-beta-L-altropyranose hydrolase
VNQISARPSPRAVFRCDASPSLGAGHVVRCLTLADTLAAGGWRSVFAVRPGTFDVLPRLAERVGAFTLVDGPPEQEAERIGSALGGPVDLVVVDHYQRGASFEAVCRRWARQVLVLSDVADRTHDADFLVDDSFGRGASDYAGLVPPRCRILAGSRYALVRPEFPRRRSAALRRRDNRMEVRRLLIAMGAADPDNFSGKAIAAAAATGLGLALDVVLGTDAPQQSAVAAQLASYPHPARLLIGTTRIADLMIAADLAIGACGTMSWERCCLGLPTIAVTMADNQEPHGRNLADAGAIHLLGRDGMTSAAAVGDALMELAADADRRRRMSRAAASVCDGGGAGRVAAILGSQRQTDRCTLVEERQPVGAAALTAEDCPG